ncbi:MAG TPA: malto-oligosyltrehalose synthase, partial [Jiangellaceae bacterium]|nr:malto-oligosyltrehalose synthase [Jiangellaceae bacterium]
GLIVDIVPNHLGVARATANPWFADVLAHGRDSAYADVFDIDWDQDKIALPVLGSPEDLQALEVHQPDKPHREAEAAELRFYEHAFPVAPGSLGGTPQQVHDRQHYRLVPWVAGEVGYRRFFHINSLAGVRQEDPAVFELTHQEIARWIRHGLVDGLRVDHPDGLRNPVEYLTRLRELMGPQRWLVIEKILAPDEPLDPVLPVDGTTGYDALRELGGVLVDPNGAGPLTQFATEHAGAPGDQGAVEYAEHAMKLHVVRTILRPEAARCARAIRGAVEVTATLDALVEALAELTAALPVYRADYTPTSRLVGSALAAAAARRPDLRVALDAVGAGMAADAESAARFHQLAGAATAKGIEDRLFYRLTRLVSLQEVGGAPDRFGVTPAEFHTAAAERAHRWPSAMTTLSTHDTKRGEDVRARIAVLSEVPHRWAETVRAASTHATPPDPLMGAMLCQNMIGVWPADGSSPERSVRARLHDYAEKAIREAGTRTEWTAVDREFEDAVHAWLDEVVDGPAARVIGTFVAEIAAAGWTNALTQKLLHLAGPGVPDVYQGTELWEDSLVDPDNRREVDHAVRRRLLAELDADGADVPSVDVTGRAKLLLVSRALRLRRQRASSFVGGTYMPLTAAGEQAQHAVGFWRGPAGSGPDVLAVGTRLSVRLAESGGWGDTGVELPPGAWTDVLTGGVHAGQVPMADLLGWLPVALLTTSDG